MTPFRQRIGEVIKMSCKFPQHRVCLKWLCEFSCSVSRRKKKLSDEKLNKKVTSMSFRATPGLFSKIFVLYGRGVVLVLVGENLKGLTLEVRSRELSVVG